MPPSVVFVCMGNICRSPAAEGVLKALAAERGVAEGLRVDSAGTISYHAGKPPDPRMREAAARRGYRLDGRSRLFQAEDAERFDLVVAMDRENLADLEEICGRRPANARLLSDFLPAGSPTDVPDPYYGGARGFDVVLDLMEQACPRILDQLLDEDDER
ncbi:MAG TPA: low molecular weight protein-tyrosine-phosphatase [Thermoanaerobaculia bacterium]